MKMIGDKMTNKNDRFTYSQMQENLPDYIFDRLSIEERQRFELTLPEYPDIQKEITEVKSVFNRIESSKIENKISSKTRNISVKVNKRISNAPPRLSRFRYLSKFILPTAALAIMVFAVLFGPFLFDSDDSSSEQIATTSSSERIFDKEELFTEFEKEIIIENQEEASNQSVIGIVPANDYYLDNADIALLVQLDEEFNSLQEEIILSALLNNQSNDYLDKNSMLMNSLISDIDEMEEDEFQKLLEGLSNEKILS